MKEIFIDCEFLREDFSHRGLVSIALSSGSDSYYAINSEMDTESLRQNDWMMENVWRHIPSERRFILNRAHPDVKSYRTIRNEVAEWFEGLSVTGESNEDFLLIAWCGGQDIVRLHGLWNHDWSWMPRSIPRYFHDLQEDINKSRVSEDDLPTQDPHTVHHALHDARHDEVILQFLREKNGS